MLSIMERLAAALLGTHHAADTDATEGVEYGDGDFRFVLDVGAPQDHRFLLMILLAWTLFIGCTTTLYVWIASRQVRPRQAPPAPASLPTSPTSKRKRHSKSFLDMQELERELLEENAAMEKQDWGALPMSLKRKCTPEQCKMIYEVLAKVFSFLRSEYVDILARDIQIVHLAAGDEVFACDEHDGSIIMVASGEVQLTIHGSGDRAFSRRVGRGETVTSALSLVASLLDSTSAADGGVNSILTKVVSSLSATASTKTMLIKVPSVSISSVVEEHPDSFLRLAQATLNQVERITTKSLVDHFGVAGKIIVTTPLLPTVPDEEDLARAVATSLGVIDESAVVNISELGRLLVFEDEYIIEERATSSSVHVVIEGTARVELVHQGQQTMMFEATRGCEIGLVNGFVGHNHQALRIVCGPGTKLLAIPDSVMARILQTKSAAMACCKHLLRQYSPLVCIADNTFDSIHLHGGETLFHKGDPCDSVFTVISGRLRAIQLQSHRGRQVETTNELVRGATLGALDMLAAGRSNSTVFAVRDSQISQMPRCVFDYVVSEYPTVLVHFTTNLAKRLSKSSPDSASADHRTGQNYLASLGQSDSSSEGVSSAPVLPLGTVAVISLTKSTKIRTFCMHLDKALKTIGRTEIVSSTKAKEALGGQWLTTSRLAQANLSAWLGELESSTDLVIYEGDSHLSQWTNLCIRQADHILLLCSDSEPPQSFLKDIVTILESAWARKNVAISVVRLREKNWTLSAVEAAKRSAASESSTSNALKRRLRLWKRSPILPRFLLPMEKYEWISCYHNVQMPFEDHGADFLRLSRRITGRAVGLVLGGGGARGLAHIGILRALEECGIHVDVVGGTSIGAFIGAMYALHPHHLDLVKSKVVTFSWSLSSVTEKLMELTLPIASFFNGSRFNRSIQDHFFDLSIEDLVLNYFCVSTDIAKSRMSVHRSGEVWKYVRASMSLQGYLPPISEGGSLLLDGGYMNNLPADVMKEEGGIKYVLAVDVGSEPRREYYSYGTALSGWWLLWNKLNPFAKTVIVPSMGDVSAALAYVSSEQHKERMKTECIDLYLRPPVLEYGTLQFEKMEEIIEVGYKYALPRVKAWAARVLLAEPDADIVEPSAKMAKFDHHYNETESESEE